jgi:hypothetical protein
MEGNRLRQLRSLEGRHVNVALRDGSRIDDCQLVSVGRGSDGTLWLYAGLDLFVPFRQVIDLWEAVPISGRAA